MQKFKDKTGRDINSIKSEEVVRITKINDDYEFEYFANREEAKSKYGEDVEIIGIGDVIYWFKRGKNNSRKDLTVEQIKSLRDIGLMVAPEKEREPIMKPKSFDDYFLLLKEMQNSKDKIGRDINDFKKNEVVKIIKINDDYEFEYFANREEARKKYGEDVETIGVGDVIYWFKRGKSSSGKKDLTAEQINWLRNIGLMVVPEKERDPVMMPKSFDDYVELLKEMQNSKEKTGRDINNIKSLEVVRITKINDDYGFEYFVNREEASKKYGEDVEIIGIGQVIYYFKRGKFSGSRKDLTVERVNQLRDIGLTVVTEKERDSIMMPKCFEDYVLLLKEMQKAKDKTGRDINSFKQVEVARIIKINSNYEFEYFVNKEEAKSKYGENVEVIGVGKFINCFKRGKSNGEKDLTTEQIKRLRDIGLNVVLENERDPIMEPKSFEDYVLLLQKLQENKIDINAIKSIDKMRIIKNDNGYDFQIAHQKQRMENGKQVIANALEYNQDDLMTIGAKINNLKKGKYSSKTYLTIDQMQTLLNIGFKFNKGVEDKIYKQEICTQHNIDLKINDKIIERISKIELISKIKYLNDKGFALVDDSGQLIDIFSMSSANIENDQRYGVSLENIINIYGKGMDRK